MRFVADQGHNHAVQVEEEHQEVETQLDERFLLVHVQLAEDLSRIQQVLVLVDPVFVSLVLPLGLRNKGKKTTYFFALNANNGKFNTIATQYPLMINRKVRNPWTAASGTM